MRLYLLVAVAALASIAAASYVPPLPYTSHYGSSHVGGSGVSAATGGSGVSAGSGGVYTDCGVYHNGVGRGRDDLFLSFLAPETRNQNYTWYEASYQCTSRKMVLVSLDSCPKDRYIASLIRQYNVPFIWTSGNKRGDSFFWANGKKIGPDTFSNWSPTGITGIPQPDNREGEEYCLAVINNKLNDGIVWHDIGCQYKKPFICEHLASNVY